MAYSQRHILFLILLYISFTNNSMLHIHGSKITIQLIIYPDIFNNAILHIKAHFMLSHVMSIF